MSKDKGRPERAKNVKQQNKEAIEDLKGRMGNLELLHGGLPGDIPANFQYLISALRQLEKMHRDLTTKHNAIINHHNLRAEADKAYFAQLDEITNLPSIESYVKFIDTYMSEASAKEIAANEKKIAEMKKQMLIEKEKAVAAKNELKQKD